MISEQKQYISWLLKTVGLALLTPFSSIAYQYLVFNESLLRNHFQLSLFLWLSGWLFLYFGYNVIEELKHE